jgi:hypothetical protein
MQKEYTTVDGIRFTRYPEAAKRNHRLYFQGLVNGKRESLHRYLYSTRVGHIPDGYIVHHANGNSADNRIENLTLMERGLHQSMHAANLWATADEAKRKRMQPEAYSEKKFAWHRSAEGRKAMSERAKNQYRETITCQLCGTVAEVKRKGALYCSAKCRRIIASRNWRDTHPGYGARYQHKHSVRP